MTKLCTALLLTCALSANCLACSCVCREGKSFKAAVTNRFNRYPTIFVGKVIEDTPEQKTVTIAPGHTLPVINHRVHFTVEDAFKGTTTPTIVSNNGDGTCSYGEMEVGKRYLVYASRAEPDSPVFIGYCCNPTRPLLADDHDVRITKNERRMQIKEVELLRKLATKNRQSGAKE